MSEINTAERISQALMVHSIKIATTQAKAKVDAELKEPYLGGLVDVRA